MLVYYVYIITNKYNSVFYIGLTNNIERRIIEHNFKVTNGFSAKYNLHKLVYLDEYSSRLDAIYREKQLKNWHRSWKLNLIRESNPMFNNLWDPETSSG